MTRKTELYALSILVAHRETQEREGPRAGGISRWRASVTESDRLSVAVDSRSWDREDSESAILLAE